MDFITNIAASPFICLGWIIVGAIAGALARRLMNSNNASLIADIGLGILGAIVGGIVAGIVGIGPGPNRTGIELVLINLVIATVGAIILIAISRAVFGRRRTA